MTTAFVLSGGGSLGAVQVGMLQALAAHGIEPDLLVGTSVGAMNAAWVAAHGASADSLAGLAEVWGRLTRRDVFPLQLGVALRGILGRSPSLTAPDRLGQLVARHAGIDTLEEARIPVHLVTAELLTGQNVRLSDGPLVTGVLASAAIPGIFPPITHSGRHLIDGGVAPHTGVTEAFDLGATIIYVLPAGTSCALPTPPCSAIGAALHALALLMQQRLAREVAEFATAATLKILPPLCPLTISAADFSHGDELIARSRQVSQEWIAAGNVDLPEPERFLSTHTHRSTAARDLVAGARQQRG
ncbi:patatin-like phospholipase family protein [Nocardioides eburneiflavus]|uniref:Patatin-like phospholipase family protein n=1 Tax=Nocardioides eburneiflavus TaxID=2518372 RepID=A0A4Z1BZT6_9ACTN|nr:patatin-like phospholipase family protein [Nocardioides eburneiflavus]TGN63244.1 patatin-like phospholipase family protein [Nocardioides eburneiflavus]